MARLAPTSCATCGTSITQNRGGTRRLFCSQLCRNRSYRRLAIEAQPTKACPICGGAVAKGHYRVYCSPKCRRAAVYVKRIGNLPLPTTCAHCGDAMKASRRTQRFCHDRCRSRARNHSRLGKLSPRERLVLLVGWPGAQLRRAA